MSGRELSLERGQSKRGIKRRGSEGRDGSKTGKSALKRVMGEKNRDIK